MGILAIFAPSGLGVRRGNHRSRIVPYNAAERRNGRIRGVQTVATIPELVLVALAFIWSRIRNMSKIKLKKGAEGATEPEQTTENKNE